MRRIAAACCCFLMGLAVARAKELVRLEIQLGLNKGVENLYVGKDVEELVFEKPSYIESIKGLGQLGNLSVMIFNNTHFVTDFSFLREAPHIKTLIISGVRILDTQFLKHLPELEFLVLDTCRLKNIEFDFISLQKLRFIDLSNNDLDSFPNLKSINSLKSPLFMKINKDIVKISKENTLPKEMEDLGDRF